MEELIKNYCHSFEVPSRLTLRLSRRQRSGDRTLMSNFRMAAMTSGLLRVSTTTEMLSPRSLDNSVGGPDTPPGNKLPSAHPT
ncbi:unnamed protein product [Arctia plantaginis]|uniref:Uncharacterized protein n=1 Tax=Arctia plantaginis TaxID=874455 RepID=A0A8S0ZSN4_ARCPL|nr:unnamed protein product [Arctia plantaginis]